MRRMMFAAIALAAMLGFGLAPSAKADCGPGACSQYVQQEPGTHILSDTQLSNLNQLISESGVPLYLDVTSDVKHANLAVFRLNAFGGTVTSVSVIFERYGVERYLWQLPSASTDVTTQVAFSQLIDEFKYQPTTAASIKLFVTQAIKCFPKPHTPWVYTLGVGLIYPPEHGYVLLAIVILLGLCIFWIYCQIPSKNPTSGQNKK